ncbi:uncharacterized protein CLUP02_10734 [Colletotrichum lupini]|uniref:Uncharacterized protein n=1 Tax=Colletotrichum lupini TaxID=145971 RepID=A0A9Q8WJM4_9PEZI|nr:uncharacterized protein CLUP02_10734 [Colletotrichum lupini]UQC85237.1 hypothetical protein CLUP02_10734 [Colletotrichum lupini]
MPTAGARAGQQTKKQGEETAEKERYKDQDGRREAPPAYPCKLRVLGAPIGIQRKYPIGPTPTSSDSAPLFCSSHTTVRKRYFPTPASFPPQLCMTGFLCIFSSRDSNIHSVFDTINQESFLFPVKEATIKMAVPFQRWKDRIRAIIVGLTRLDRLYTIRKPFLFPNISAQIRVRGRRQSTAKKAAKHARTVG